MCHGYAFLLEDRQSTVDLIQSRPPGYEVDFVQLANARTELEMLLSGCQLP